MILVQRWTAPRYCIYARNFNVWQMIFRTQPMLYGTVYYAFGCSILPTADMSVTVRRAQPPPGCCESRYVYAGSRTWLFFPLNVENSPQPLIGLSF